ncbi:MAG: type II secretion system F family protein [Kiritimatiellia bacterium]
MANFGYVAFNGQKAKVSGAIEASDRRGALRALQAQGLTPLSVSEQKSASSKESSVAPQGSFWKLSSGPINKMKPAEVLLFSSELADLIEAGMTLGAALNSLANQGDPTTGMCVVASDLRDRIMRGEAFSDAVDGHPKTFPNIYGNMIRAGEASGAMVEVLRRLTEHYERNQAMKSKIVSAMTYPSIVLGMGVLAVIFAMIKIVPQFSELFQSMGQELPLPTRMLVGMSEGLIKYGVLYAVGIIVSVVLFRKWIRGSGRMKWDAFKLKVPLIKGLIASGAFASLAFTLQTLLANGVNVLNALRIAEETSGNSVIAAELRTARERVTDGTTISGPLAQCGVFPRMMTDMMALGEQTGNLPNALGHIGRRYEAELNRNIKIFTTALEPILIIFVALMVGFVAVAILSAVFSATSAMGH